MAMYFAPPHFPFSKLFSLGIVTAILGVLSVTLGVVDLVYTQMRYTSPTCNNNQYLLWQCPNKPCDNTSITWALVAPGIWAGVFVLLAGAVSVSLLHANSFTLKSKRDGTGVLAGLVAFPLGPATLVACALRLFYMNTYFYCVNATNQIIITDYLEFLMPVIVGVIALLSWCIALAILVNLCQKGRLTTRDEYEYGGRCMDDYGPLDSPRARRRPYMLPEPYEPRFYDRPRTAPWRSWRERLPYPGRPYATAPRSEPLPSFPRRYIERDDPRVQRGYYTTKTYSRY